VHELRYAVRSLGKHPGFCLAAVLTLALGIGANTTIFSVFYAVLLRPLPYTDAERLVMLWQKKPDGKRNAVSGLNFLEWKRQTTSFDRLAAMSVQLFNVAGPVETVQVPGAQVSADFFATLGVAPQRGREFAAGESMPAVVISRSFWQDQFGGDPGALGRDLTVNGVSRTIIGILPQGFEFVGIKGIQIWTSIDFLNKDLVIANNLAVVGRLKPRVTVARADQEIKSVAKYLEQQFPRYNSGWSAMVIPLQDFLVGNVRTALSALLIGVGFILLIACVNVANLLMARSEARQREIAIRTALGGGRWRLIRQLLAEALVLALAGCALGLAIASAGMRVLIRFDAGQFPRLNEIGLDPRVLGFAIAITVITGFLFALLPARQLLNDSLNPALRGSGRSLTDGRSGLWSRNILVTSEIALSLLLMVGAGLLVRSFFWLEHEGRGFAPEQRLTFRVSFAATGPMGAVRMASSYRRVLDNVASVPGVQGVAANTSLPLDGYRQVGMYFDVAGMPPRSLSDRPVAGCNLINAGYFKTLSIPILQGREFGEHDIEQGRLVAIISESLAKRYFGGQNPLGRMLLVATPGRTGSTAPREVVGVAADIRYLTRGADDSVEIYLPYLQNTWPINWVVVRSERDPRELVPAMRAALRSDGWAQPISEVSSMEDRIAKLNGTPRWNSLLAAIFAGIALALAAVGIYGVVSFTTTQRTREIGIRMALGATNRDIVIYFARQALLLALAGVAIGLVGHFAVSRLLRTLLYGTHPNDVFTIVTASLLLGLIAIIASYIPVRRALRADPMVALRTD
jgi:putative ABC transport system permease protein